MKIATKLSSLILLTLFLGTMFLSLFHFQGMNMNMSGGMNTRDCPFMSHSEVICSMNFTDHIGAWKTAFLAITPTLIILLTASAALAVIASIPPNLIFKPKYLKVYLHKYTQERIYTFFNRALQEFFSQGILNPKLF